VLLLFCTNKYLFILKEHHLFDTSQIYFELVKLFGKSGFKLEKSGTAKLEIWNKIFKSCKTRAKIARLS